MNNKTLEILKKYNFISETATPEQMNADKVGVKLSKMVDGYIKEKSDDPKENKRTYDKIISTAKSTLQGIKDSSLIDIIYRSFEHNVKILGANKSKLSKEIAGIIKKEFENKGSEQYSDSGITTNGEVKDDGEQKETKPKEDEPEQSTGANAEEKEKEEVIELEGEDGKVIKVTDGINKTVIAIDKNKILNDRQRQVYSDFISDIKSALTGDEVETKSELEKLIGKYGLEVNSSGQVYVNAAKDKGDDNKVKKGITTSNSKWIVDAFNHHNIDISYKQAEQEPHSLLSATAKPNLGIKTIKTAEDDSRVKKIFSKEPLSSLDGKYHRVYGPKDEHGNLLDNKGGKNARSYLKHSINSNEALDSTIETAKKLVDEGKLSPKIVSEFEQHKQRLNDILSNHIIPSSEASEAVGNSYATLAANLYNQDIKVAEGVMKQFAEMALYDTEIAIGDECYLPAHGSFPSGDKLKVSTNIKEGNKVERIASISVKYGLAGGDFGYYGFPGETAQYQKYHPDAKKRDMLSNKPGMSGYTLGIKDSIIDNDEEFSELMINSGGFDKCVSEDFIQLLRKHKEETQKVIDDNNGILRLSTTKKSLDDLDSEYAAKMDEYINKDELKKLLGSDNVKLALKNGPSCLISMIGFANILKTSGGLPVIEHNHQQFINGEYHSSTDDSATGTDKIKHWKMIWRPRGERTQGIAASYNSKRKDIDNPDIKKRSRKKPKDMITDDINTNDEKIVVILDKYLV